jgi:hypothetical protein
MSQRFLERTGRDPDASIYKVVFSPTRDFSKVQPSKQAYHEAYEKKTNEDTGYDDLIDFIELINNTPDEIFAYELRRAFDVAAYLDHYAVVVLTKNADTIPHNSYLIHDLTTDRWELVPYDLDRAFDPSWDWENRFRSPIDMGTQASPIVPWGYNSVLLTRVLNVPQFRAYYCHRLAEFMETFFSDEAMYPLIDETYRAIEQDGLRDWRKYRADDNTWFIATPSEYKTYVTERKKFLWSEIATYCPPDRPYLTINEVMVENQATLEDADEPGEFPAWFEVYNESLETADLSGMYLTNDRVDPTRFQIAEGVTVPAGGFVTFFADGDTEQGPLHTSFELDKNGGMIGVFSGTQQIDAYYWGGHAQHGLQAGDVSYARYPDGVDHWRPFTIPTPGRSNELHPPVIGATNRSPLLPTSYGTVTITATITDDGAVLTATLSYSATEDRVEGFVEVPMVRLQEDRYMARIPTQPGGSLVQYYILAGDDDGQASTDLPDPSDDLYEYRVDYQSPNLLINEFMADNESAFIDPSESNEFPDWIELYNPGSEPVDLGGRYLSDDPANPTKFRIADGITISARGFLLFYADGDPEQGPFHANFRLNGTGESVGLFDIDAAANQPLDLCSFDRLPVDVSRGRYPDGNDAWIFFTHSTPDKTNEMHGIPPVISSVRHTPPSPSSDDDVIVTADVIDEGTIVTSTLWYSTGVGFTAVPMALSGPAFSDVEGAEQFMLHKFPFYAEGAVRRGAYAATIPAQPDGTLVAYYVRVEDDRGLFRTDPLRGAEGGSGGIHRYVVGYHPPPLSVNEFMADNVATLEDPDEPGEFPDWVELYNPGPAPIDLGGKYLTDDLADPTKFQIADGLVIPVGGFVLFYCDGESEQGPLHTNFRLSKSGESIALFDADATGNQLIDAYTFGLQTPDVSERRYHNGGDTWLAFRTPTPGKADIPIFVYLPVLSKRAMDAANQP